MTNQQLRDDEVRAAFLVRAGGPPRPDLADRIRAATGTTRQSRAFSILPSRATSVGSRLAWAAVVAALGVALIGVLTFGVGRFAVTPPDATASPTIDASTAPSPSPSVEPSASSDPSPSTFPNASPSDPRSQAPGETPYVPADLGPDRIGHVVATDGLRVRRLPTVAETSERLEPMLDAGVMFYVVAGPVFADGYAWYQVDPYGLDPGLTPFGWVAAGSRDGEPWIENLLDGCDSIGLSIELLGSAPGQENLYCYGGDEIELTGNLHCDVGDIEGLSAGPDWVEFDRYCELRAPDWTIHDGISLRVWGQAATRLLDPGGPIGGQYTVVGHFDDPAANECESPGFDADAPEPAEVVLRCRMAFVATSVTPAD
jgi:hypothetical protein